MEELPFVLTFYMLAMTLLQVVCVINHLKTLITCIDHLLQTFIILENNYHFIPCSHFH
jgi:hypothetical protein